MRTTEPIVIVSTDTLIGPRLTKDLRPYCPSPYLEEFDRFSASTAVKRDAARMICLDAGTRLSPAMGSRRRST